jgi:hypothetical protein
MITSTDVDCIEFARVAADYFNTNPSKHTFTEGDVNPGEWFAVRWAMKGATCISVLVFALPFDATLVGDLDLGKAASNG